MTKRKELYEGQHVKVLGVCKQYWRCEVMTGPDSGKCKKFQPYHVSKWVERKKPPPPLCFQPPPSTGSSGSGAQGAAEEAKGDLMHVFGSVEGY